MTALGLLMGLILGSYSSLLPVGFRTWKFARRLDSRVDPALLRQWSTQLVKAHPVEEEVYYDLRGTNLLLGVKSAWYWRPCVYTRGESNAPAVVILWAHGPILIIGGEKPQDLREGWREWKPGIYVGWTTG